MLVTPAMLALTNIQDIDFENRSDYVKAVTSIGSNSNSWWGASSLGDKSDFIPDLKWM